MRSFDPRIYIAHAESWWNGVCEADETVEERMAGEDIAASMTRDVKRAVVGHFVETVRHRV